MIDNEKVIQAIFDAMDEVNELLPEDQRLIKEKETILFGESGTLDSLGLVNFIIATEQRIEEVFDVSLTLADEKAMSQRNSPFRNVETLAKYTTTLLEEQTNG